jgi:cell division protein FtsZ
MANTIVNNENEDDVIRTSNVTSARPKVKIKIIGIGGAGGNILTRMYKKKAEGVDFVAVNTDTQGLHFTKADEKVNIGLNITRGLGAGMDPEIGRQAAEESAKEVAEMLGKPDLIFIASGLGGGTGSGAAPVIAKIAKETGAIVVAVVTKPFFFEGPKRMEIANESWEKLYQNIDSMITINNDRIFNVIDKDTPILDAFKQIDEILKQGVQGISDLINFPGLINLDFANLRTILKNSGESIIGIGKAIGKDRAVKAAKMAIESPLLDLSINGASRILFNISGQNDLSLSEITEAARIITDSAAKDAKIIFGASYDNELKNGELKITVIAGGFNKEAEPEKLVPTEQFVSFFKKESDDFYNLNQKLSDEEEIVENKKIEINKEEKNEDEDEKEENKELDDIDIPPFLRKFKKFK